MLPATRKAVAMQRQSSYPLNLKMKAVFDVFAVPGT
jgi:hypothetical protein